MSELTPADERFVRTSAGYGLFYAALLSVCCVAVVWPYLAKKVKSYLRPTEDFAVARSTQPWWSITCSFFSTSLGCWVLTAPASIAVEYSMWGVVGYAVATAFPWVCVAVFGPKMRRITDGRGFTSTDFIRIRLGIANHVLYSFATFATVFLSYVVECISLSLTLTAISPFVKPIVVTTSMAVAVFLYTTLSGVQATLLTDRFQFMAISTLIVVMSIGVFGIAGRKIDHAAVSNNIRWTGDGFVCLVVLTISCWYPTFLDPASWSRMYAAKSEKDAKIGLFVAAAVLMIPMLLFGMMGIYAGAAADEIDASGQISPVTGMTANENLSIFTSLTLIHPAWNGVVVMLATLLSTSTVDTMSSNFTTFFVSQCKAFNIDTNINYARICTLVTTLVGLCVIIKNPPAVMTLFMCMNLMCTCTAAGLLMSLWDIVTPTGVFAGAICGALSVCTFGWAYYGTFKGGFNWWLLPEGEANLLALYTFLAAGGVSAAVTFVLSALEFKLRPGAREEQAARLALLRDLERNKAQQNDEETGDQMVASKVDCEVLVCE